MKAAFFCLLVTLALGHKAMAQVPTPPQPAKEVPPPYGRGYDDVRKKIDVECSNTANRAASKLGQKIASHARDEFYIFGGHRINENGSLFSFGVVESEQTEKGTETSRQLSHLGWWNVGRYWRTLAKNNGATAPTILKAAEMLDIYSMENASGKTVLEEKIKKYQVKADRVLKLVNEITIEDALLQSVVKGFANLEPSQKETERSRVRELLFESVFRAAVSDTAWSAAFVSHVVAAAGIQRPDFKFSSSHEYYIGQAFDVARDGTASGIYRACPLDQAMPREGDLVCYTRGNWEVDNKWKAKHDVQKMSNHDILWWEHFNKRRASATHCDVVAHVDEPRAKPRYVYVIGGNVQQSVTIKKLKLDTKASPTGEPVNTIQVDQSQDCGKDDGWGSFPKPSARIPIAPQVGSSDPKTKQVQRVGGCSLNRKNWFTLLQLR